MTQKYICEICGEPCIIEVEKGASEPFQCPYNETPYPEWELIEEDISEEIPEFTFKGKTCSGIYVYGNLSELRYKYHNIEAGTYISNSKGMPYAYRVIPETVERIKRGD